MEIIKIFIVVLFLSICTRVMGDLEYSQESEDSGELSRSGTTGSTEAWNVEAETTCPPDTIDAKTEDSLNIMPVDSSDSLNMASVGTFISQNRIPVESAGLPTRRPNGGAGAPLSNRRPMGGEAGLSNRMSSGNTVLRPPNMRPLGGVVSSPNVSSGDTFLTNMRRPLDTAGLQNGRSVRNTTLSPDKRPLPGAVGSGRIPNRMPMGNAMSRNRRQFGTHNEGPMRNVTLSNIRPMRGTVGSPNRVLTANTTLLDGRVMENTGSPRRRQPGAASLQNGMSAGNIALPNRGHVTAGGLYNRMPAGSPNRTSLGNNTLPLRRHAESAASLNRRPRPVQTSENRKQLWELLQQPLQKLKQFQNQLQELQQQLQLPLQQLSQLQQQLQRKIPAIASGNENSVSLHQQSLASQSRSRSSHQSSLEEMQAPPHLGHLEGNDEKVAAIHTETMENPEEDFEPELDHVMGSTMDNFREMGREQNGHNSRRPTGFHQSNGLERNTYEHDDGDVVASSELYARSQNEGDLMYGGDNEEADDEFHGGESGTSYQQYQMGGGSSYPYTPTGNDWNVHSRRNNQFESFPAAHGDYNDNQLHAEDSYVY